MNYLDRIRQIDGQKIFAHVPEIEPTKPPKAPSVSSVGTPHGVFANAQVEKMHVDPVENDEGVASFTWLMHFIDRDPLTVNFSPAVTHGGALACYPNAVAAEPIEPVLELLAATLLYPDDRRTCRQCANFSGGVCTMASPGGVVSAITGYRPGEMFREQLHRCEGFMERMKDANHRG